MQARVGLSKLGQSMRKQRSAQQLTTVRTRARHGRADMSDQFTAVQRRQGLARLGRIENTGAKQNILTDNQIFNINAISRNTCEITTLLIRELMN